MTRASSIFLTGLAAASIAFAAITAAQISTDDGGARFDVVVVGLHNDRGQFIGALYASPERWLQRMQHIEDCEARIRGGIARCSFAVPAERRVAFGGYHDEDGDRVYDRNFFGIPEEGYAFSNDAHETFGPPSFSDAAFTPIAGRPLVVHAGYGI